MKENIIFPFLQQRKTSQPRPFSTSLTPLLILHVFTKGEDRHLYFIIIQVLIFKRASFGMELNWIKKIVV